MTANHGTVQALGRRRHLGRRADEWADVGTHTVTQGAPVADCASNHTWEDGLLAICCVCGGGAGPNGHVVASWPAG